MNLITVEIDLDAPETTVYYEGEPVARVIPLPTGSAYQTLDAIISRQGVKPIKSIEDLKGDFWPEDEHIDDFAATIRRWRDESIRTDIRGIDE